MVRAVTEDQLDALSEDGVVLCELVEFGFSPPLRLTNAGRNVTAGGYAWKGDGTLRSISSLQEGLALAAHGSQVELSGYDVALVSLALNGLGKGKYVSVYVAPFSPTTGKVLGPPVLESRQRIDTMTIVDGVDE